MVERIDWKKRALAAEVRANKAEQYCMDYGNATRTCPRGYWQQPGLICHECGADPSIKGRAPCKGRTDPGPPLVVEG